MFKKFIPFLIAPALIFSAASKNAEAGQYTILPSAVRTATTNSSDIVKTTEKGAHFIINVTAVPGVDTITPKIQGKDFLGNYYDILVGSAISTTGITVLKVNTGIGTLPNGSANDILPDVYRVVITHSAGSNFTYTVTENTWQ